jgi:hypothetical protein
MSIKKLFYFILYELKNPILIRFSSDWLHSRGEKSPWGESNTSLGSKKKENTSLGSDVYVIYVKTP